MVRGTVFRGVTLTDLEYQQSWGVPASTGRELTELKNERK